MSDKLHWVLAGIGDIARRRVAAATAQQRLDIASLEATADAR